MTLQRISSAGITLAEALSIWVGLTGVEPGKGGCFTLGEWGIRDLHKTIQEALDLDPTEITGKMILSYIVQNYFEDRTFTVDQMLVSPEKVAAYLSQSRTLATYLRSDDVQGQASAFANDVKNVLRRYESLTPSVEKILDVVGNQGDRAALAILRRDALRSVKKLQVNQFLDGDAEAPGIGPVYGKFLYQWNNINSMLKAMVNAPSGVTVNMIRSESNPFGVYFVFAIRNGGRLFTFTDREWTPHPLAESMWRRPDKILAARAERNWFPYDVAGLKFTEEGRAYIDFSAGKSLVEYQGKATPVKLIAELDPMQVIWITMMLDLIVEKFWHQHHKEIELSYTGEMIKVSTPLLETAKQANLPLAVRSISSVEMAPITLNDVHSDNIVADDVGKLGDGANRWLEERYAHQVLPESVDMVGDPGQELLVRYAPSSGAQKSESTSLVVTPSIVSKSDLSAVTKWHEMDKAVSTMARINVLDATSFGTKAQLEKDRKFLARANYASQIQALAKAEFAARSEEIKKWVRARVAANLDNLKPLLMAKDIWVHTEHGFEFGSHSLSGISYNPKDKTRKMVSHHDVAEVNGTGFYYQSGRDPLVFGRTPYKKSCLQCHYTGAPSSQLLQIAPETAAQLAYLCGVSIQELPDVLQHWNKVVRYTGNHLLNRIDPLVWKIQNPWLELDFRVNVFVSKRAFAALQKETKDKPWVEPGEWMTQK